MLYPGGPPEPLRQTHLKASIPIVVIAGAAGVWLGLVLLVLRAFGIYLD